MNSSQPNGTSSATGPTPEADPDGGWRDPNASPRNVCLVGSGARAPKIAPAGALALTAWAKGLPGDLAVVNETIIRRGRPGQGRLGPRRSLRAAQGTHA